MSRHVKTRAVIACELVDVVVFQSLIIMIMIIVIVVIVVASMKQL